MKAELPEGFYAPLHRSLTEPLLMLGIPRKLAIGLWLPGMYFVLAFHIYSLIVVLLAAHLAAAYCCRRDPHIIEVIRQNRGARNRYLP